MALLVAVIALVVLNELRLEKVFEEGLDADYKFLGGQLEVNGAEP